VRQLLLHLAFETDDGEVVAARLRHRERSVLQSQFVLPPPGAAGRRKLNPWGG
jgi:hypothetical protein